MRAVIVVILIISVLGLVGWLRFSSPNGEPTIRVDTQKIKQDTSEIVEKTKNVVDRTAEKVDVNLDRDQVK